MRAKSVMLLMLALGCGLVASIGITQVMDRGKSDDSNAGETQPIFVAMVDIPTGDLITAEMLELEEWPKDKVPDGALMKIEEVEGRRPKTKIWTGTVLLENQLLGQGESPGATTQIPVGYRVVSVRVDDESGISNLIRPGDRVDVLLYIKRSPGSIEATLTKTIFQDLKVFAVNDVFDLDRADGQETFNAKTISLLVTPPQVEKFTLASEMGQIRLALRSHEDKDKVDLPGAFPYELDEEGERSNRDNEELVQTPPGQSDVDRFFETLNNQGRQPPVVVEEETPRDTWTTRVILGGDVTEVVMETEAAPKAVEGESAASSGFNLWRMISPIRRRSDAEDETPDAEAEMEEPPAESDNETKPNEPEDD